MNAVGKQPGYRAVRRLSQVLTLVAITMGSVSVWAADHADRSQQAVALYDAGDYEAAKPLFEALVADGHADGSTLYRLYFCQREAADDAARSTLLKARTALQAEVADAKGLDIPFYLANVHRNTGRISEATRIATEATARVESGKLKAPTDGMGMFQLGKLYADQENQEQATAWYQKSIQAFAAAGAKLPPSAQWAARYLGEQAFNRSDWKGVEDNLGALLDAGTGTIKDYNQLAMARIRTNDYEGAATAWRRAGTLNPVEGDHPRYCARLAKQAHELGSLPDKAPDGRDWATLDPADLEGMMSARSAAAREALIAAPERVLLTDQDAIDKDNQWAAEYNAKIAKDRVVFLRAALEYGMRGLPLRETAFRGGYAPMIFHARQWKLPPRPRPSRNAR